MLTVLFYSLIGGVFSLAGGAILLKSKKSGEGLARYATPFAAGVLLAAAFTDLLPEALAGGNMRTILLYGLWGLLGFFFLERFLRWFHHHHEHENGKEKASNSLIVIGDTLHNALDGVAIGAAFLVDVPTGIVATLAVATHEIPQEIGDFGLLLKNGMAKTRVLMVNAISALATTTMAVLVYSVGDSASFPTEYLLAVTAGFFIYIAASDIIPEIHEPLKGKGRDIRPWLLLTGALFVVLVSPVAHDYIDVAHEEEHSASESKKYVLPEFAPAPIINAQVARDASGLTVVLEVYNFKLTPDKVGQKPVSGEGHAHLYAHGKKITRLYDDWTFIPADSLPDDFDEVTINLSNNDHSEYVTHDGGPIEETFGLASYGSEMGSDGHNHSH